MINRIVVSLAAVLCIALVAGCASYQRAHDPGTRAERAAPAAEATPASAESAEYRLGPGDRVRITVYNNADLTTEAQIAQDGRIRFPLIGEITIGGLSRADAERTIARQLASGGFIRQAHVNLLITEYRSQQVAVLGEVSKPGRYPINQAASVTEMLAAAGGITSKASHLITVIRKDGNGESRRYEINVRDLLASDDPAADMRVDRDDVIYVPPAGVFYIYGEVRKPGAYPLVPNMTVRQALSVGGGLTVRGTERGIKVERRGPDGRPRTRSVSLTETLHPDDVIRVPESWF